jgi:hypothetical protein
MITPLSFPAATLMLLTRSGAEPAKRDVPVAIGRWMFNAGRFSLETWALVTAVLSVTSR